MDRFNARLAALIVAGLFTASAAQAALITPVGATASSTWDNGLIDLKAVHLIDGSGMTNPDAVTLADTHTNGHPLGGRSKTFWHSGALNGSPDSEYVDFDLGGLHHLDGVAIWNFNANSGVNESNRGVNAFNLIASTNSVFGDGDDVIINNLSIVKASGEEGTPAQVLDFTTIMNVQYVRVDIISNHGGVVTGLSEVRFLGTPVPEPASLALLAVGAGLIVRRKR